MIANMNENEEYRSIVVIPIHTTTHPLTQPIGQRAFGTRWCKLTAGTGRGKKASPFESYCGLRASRLVLRIYLDITYLGSFRG